MKMFAFPGLGNAPSFLSTHDLDIKATDPKEVAILANVLSSQGCDCDPGSVIDHWPVTDERGQSGVAFIVATPDEHQGQFCHFLCLAGYWSQDVMERVEEDVKRISEAVYDAEDETDGDYEKMAPLYTTQVKEMLGLYNLQPRP